MAAVNYTAKRSLQSGVSVGTAVDFEFACQGIDRRTKVERSTKSAQGGKREHIKTRTDELWNITTSPVLADDFGDFRQFLDSVDAGETFTFDPYGTIAAPVMPMLCQLDSDGYSENRVSVRYMSTSFTVLKVGAGSALVGRALIAGWDVD